MRIESQSHLLTTALSVDLLDKWERSDDKIEGWTRRDAEQALLRYQRFLALHAVYKGVALAPTRDIDAIWHLHMMSPVAYYSDCMALYGYILDHDGGFGHYDHEQIELEAVFRSTAEKWRTLFGEPYLSQPNHKPEKCWHDCQSRCWHACKS